MLSLRKYELNEVEKISNILRKEGIKDLKLEDLIYVVLDGEDLIGAVKAKQSDNKWELVYIVIREDKRGDDLGDALLRVILNNLYNLGVEKIYYKSYNLYFIKKGFILNDNNNLELNIPNFFNKGCNSCGGCNVL